MFRPMDDESPLPRRPEGAARPPALDGEIAVDVAVVGGGITGESTALHLASTGRSVAVLEAREFGWGGSGRAYGQVVPYAKHGRARMLRKYGRETGARVADLVASGPDLVFDLVRRYAIECDARRTGLIFAAHAESGARHLRDRAAYWRSRGAPLEYLAGPPAAEVIGSDYYPACLLDRRGGSLDPLAYVRGLAMAARAAGAQLFAGSPAIGLDRDGAGWRVRTPGGSVRAESLALCMNAYVSGPFERRWPALRRSFIPMRGYQLASAPLGPNRRRGILPEGRSLTDTRHLFSGIKMLADGRLHVSVDGPAFDPRGAPDADFADRRVREVFPQIGSVTWENGWTGWIAVTPDQFPRIHELDSGVWCALGYSGRGIAFGTLLGREIARFIRRDPADPPQFPKTPPRPIPGRALAPAFVKALMAYYRVADRRAMAGYVTPRGE